MVNTNGMLRTGEAARRLGVSRQHVVDLCNQGRLPYITVGAHRRIPAQALNAWAAVIGAAGTDWQQSQWLHAALAPRLVLDPAAVIGKARDNLARFRTSAAQGKKGVSWGTPVRYVPVTNQPGVYVVVDEGRKARVIGVVFFGVGNGPLVPSLFEICRLRYGGNT